MVIKLKLVILFIVCFTLSSCNHKCNYCDGTGYVYSGCEYCNYSGYIFCSNCDYGYLYQKCNLCDGDGLLIDYYEINCNTTMICQVCEGTGYDSYDLCKCNECNGTGEIICNKCNGTGTIIIETFKVCPRCIRGYVKCPQCNGEYRIICESCNGGEKIICDHCDGTGEEDD